MEVSLTYKEKVELLKILREQEVRLKGAIESTSTRVEYGESEYFTKHLVKLNTKLKLVNSMQEKLKQQR